MAAMASSVDERIAGLLRLLENAASSDYIGEGVSQLEHALQAAQLASEASAPDAEVLAALLHDVGHLCAASDAERMRNLGVHGHEDVGADHLEALGFRPETTRLVRGHVAAKRYLVATRPSYAARLSPASTATLALQGGPMTADQCAAFEADPLHEAMLRLRSWDEAAKMRDRRVPPLSSYVPLMAEQLSARA